MDKSRSIHGMRRRKPYVEDCEDSPFTVELRKRTHKLLNLDAEFVRELERPRFFRDTDNFQIPKLRRSVVTRAYQNFKSSTPAVSRRQSGFFPFEGSSQTISPVRPLENEEEKTLTNNKTDSDKEEDVSNRQSSDKENFIKPGSVSQGNFTAAKSISGRDNSANLKRSRIKDVTTFDKNSSNNLSTKSNDDSIRNNTRSLLKTKAGSLPNNLIEELIQEDIVDEEANRDDEVPIEKSNHSNKCTINVEEIKNDSFQHINKKRTKTKKKIRKELYGKKIKRKTANRKRILHIQNKPIVAVDKNDDVSRSDKQDDNEKYENHPDGQELFPDVVSEEIANKDPQTSLNTTKRKDKSIRKDIIQEMVDTNRQKRTSTSNLSIAIPDLMKQLLLLESMGPEELNNDSVSSDSEVREHIPIIFNKRKSSNKSTSKLTTLSNEEKLEKIKKLDDVLSRISKRNSDIAERSTKLQISKLEGRKSFKPLVDKEIQTSVRKPFRRRHSKLSEQNNMTLESNQESVSDEDESQILGEFDDRYAVSKSILYKTVLQDLPFTFSNNYSFDDMSQADGHWRVNDIAAAILKNSANRFSTNLNFLKSAKDIEADKLKKLNASHNELYHSKSSTSRQSLEDEELCEQRPQLRNYSKRAVSAINRNKSLGDTNNKTLTNSASKKIEKSKNWTDDSEERDSEYENERTCTSDEVKRNNEKHERAPERVSLRYNTEKQPSQDLDDSDSELVYDEAFEQCVNKRHTDNLAHTKNNTPSELEGNLNKERNNSHLNSSKCKTPIHQHQYSYKIPSHFSNKKQISENEVIENNEQFLQYPNKKHIGESVRKKNNIQCEQDVNLSKQRNNGHLNSFISETPIYQNQHISRTQSQFSNKNQSSESVLVDNGEQFEQYPDKTLINESLNKKNKTQSEPEVHLSKQNDEEHLNASLNRTPNHQRLYKTQPRSKETAMQRNVDASSDSESSSEMNEQYITDKSSREVNKRREHLNVSYRESINTPINYPNNLNQGQIFRGIFNMELESAAKEKIIDLLLLSKKSSNSENNGYSICNSDEEERLSVVDISSQSSLRNSIRKSLFGNQSPSSRHKLGTNHENSCRKVNGTLGHSDTYDKKRASKDVDKINKNKASTANEVDTTDLCSVRDRIDEILKRQAEENDYSFSKNKQNDSPKRPRNSKQLLSNKNVLNKLPLDDVDFQNRTPQNKSFTNKDLSHRSNLSTNIINTEDIVGTVESHFENILHKSLNRTSNQHYLQPEATENFPSETKRNDNLAFEDVNNQNLTINSFSGKVPEDTSVSKSKKDVVHVLSDRKLRRSVLSSSSLGSITDHSVQGNVNSSRNRANRVSNQKTDSPSKRSSRYNQESVIVALTGKDDISDDTSVTVIVPKTNEVQNSSRKISDTANNENEVFETNNIPQTVDQSSIQKKTSRNLDDSSSTSTLQKEDEKRSKVRNKPKSSTKKDVFKVPKSKPIKKQDEINCIDLTGCRRSQRERKPVKNMCMGYLVLNTASEAKSYADKLLSPEFTELPDQLSRTSSYVSLFRHKTSVTRNSKPSKKSKKESTDLKKKLVVNVERIDQELHHSINHHSFEDESENTIEKKKIKPTKLTFSSNNTVSTTTNELDSQFNNGPEPEFLEFNQSENNSKDTVQNVNYAISLLESSSENNASKIDALEKKYIRSTKSPGKVENKSKTNKSISKKISKIISNSKSRMKVDKNTEKSCLLQSQVQTNDITNVLMNEELVSINYVWKKNVVENQDATQMRILRIPPCGNKPCMISKNPLKYYVVEGEGRIQLQNNFSNITTDSQFVIPAAGISYSIVNTHPKKSLKLCCFKPLTSSILK